MPTPTRELLRARESWEHRGDRRPAFAEEPGPGRESVWDYPRPPRIEVDARRVRVVHAGETIAESRRSLRVLETASPPTFYLPRADVRMDRLEPVPGRSLCEWKGEAHSWKLAGDRAGVVIAWCYPDPFPEFAVLADAVAFYPGRIECRVDDERVVAQPGGYYGGWITSELAGPFKGGPGSAGW